MDILEGAQHYLQSRPQKRCPSARAHVTAARGGEESEEGSRRHVIATRAEERHEQVACDDAPEDERADVEQEEQAQNKRGERPVRAGSVQHERPCVGADGRVRGRKGDVEEREDRTAEEYGRVEEQIPVQREPEDVCSRSRGEG
jgi:hypothetical protein